MSETTKKTLVAKPSGKREFREPQDGDYAVFALTENGQLSEIKMFTLHKDYVETSEDAAGQALADLAQRSIPSLLIATIVAHLQDGQWDLVGIMFGHPGDKAGYDELADYIRLPVSMVKNTFSSLTYYLTVLHDLSSAHLILGLLALSIELRYEMTAEEVANVDRGLAMFEAGGTLNDAFEVMNAIVN